MVFVTVKLFWAECPSTSICDRSEQTLMSRLKFASECRVVFVTVKLFRAACPSTSIRDPEPLGFYLNLVYR